jgi:hypothetical protein
VKASLVREKKTGRAFKLRDTKSSPPPSSPPCQDSVIKSVEGDRLSDGEACIHACEKELLVHDGSNFPV